jgi:tetratricopeptide (TPR) repeat protein
MDLRPAEFHTLPMEERVRAVMSEWQADLPRLLIFDNCEDEEVLEQWLPPTGGCRVLVTSRNANWDDFLSVTALKLGVLSRQDSVKLLRKYRPDLPPDDPELNAIAQELGDLPLALDLAGRYLKRYARDFAPDAYLQEISDPRLLEHPSLRRARGISPTRHEMDVWRTFALSYRRLDADDEIDALALRILARAVRLAPGEPAPEELLSRSLDPDGAPGTGAALPATLVRDALDRLTEVGLMAEEREGIYTMHRLVAAFALGEAPDDDSGAAVEVACEQASLEAATEGNPARQELIIPHVLFLAGAAMERVDDLAGILCLAAEVGLGQLGAYEAALPYAQRAMDIAQDLYGPYNRLTLQRRTNVGRLFKAMGERETAKAIYEEVLRDQEGHLGRNDIDVAATINNMGVLLWHEDLFHEILPLYGRALRIRERVWRRTDLNEAKKRRENAINLAQSHANMGALLMDLGRPQQAGPHLDAALDLLTNEFGPNHERNANTLVTRGSALRALGREADALDSFTVTLDIYKNVTSSPTEGAGRAITHLGSLCAALAEDEGVYDHQRAPLRERATDCLQAALTGSEGAYGEDHPLTGALHRALAEVRGAQGDHTEACRHRAKADPCRELNLRGADAEAATGISRSGRSLVEWGLNDEAEVYLRRALEIRREVLGGRSLVTSNSFFNLGILLRIRGEDARAREILQRALDVRTEVCGPTHPATELVRENLRLLDG